MGTTEAASSRAGSQSGEGLGGRGAIVFVSRNGLHLTRKAVRSAEEQDVPVSVLLVDNASTDGTPQWAAAHQGPVPFAVMALSRQLSLAACWNRALRALWKMGHTHALVCNNDIEIRPDTYRLLELQGGPFVTCVSVDSADRLVYPESETDALARLANPRPHPDFSCFLIRKSVTDAGCWFDERCWPAYVEDCFMHIQMHREGIKAVCVDVPFLHHGAKTLGAADAAEQHKIRVGADVNRALFKREYGCVPGTPEYERLFL